MVTREAWLQERRTMLTASDVAAVLGVDPRRGPLAVYAQKVGDLETADDPVMQRGRWMEPGVIMEYARDTGRPVVPGTQHELLRHTDLPWLGATLDARTEGCERTPAPASGMGPLEAKMVGPAHKLEWLDGKAPVYFEVQLQIQIEVLGAAWGSLAALTSLFGPGPEVRDRLRDPRFIHAAVPHLEAFMWSLKERIPPPADALPGTTAAIKALWEKDDGTTVSLDDDAMALVTRWEEVTSLTRDAQRTETTIENQLRVLLGSATFGSLPDGSYLSNKTIQRKAFSVAESAYRKLGRFWPKVKNRRRG